MRPILSSRNRALLRRFVTENTLLAFDFDGTLVPLVSEPDAASIKPRTRRLLSELASRRPCIVVSGRSRSDVRSRLPGIPLAEFIGNHGIEPCSCSPAIARKVALWAKSLRKPLKSVPGVMIENKIFSLSVHYRKARHKARARAAVLRAVSALPGARLIGGKLVVNVLPEDAPDKGTAVEQERRKRNFAKVIYVGDDTTDERAFALASTGRCLAIRVGPSKTSIADFYIRNQGEMDRLLKFLLEFDSNGAEPHSNARAALQV